MTEPRGSVDLAEEQRARDSSIFQAGFAAGVDAAHKAALGFPFTVNNPYEHPRSG